MIHKKLGNISATTISRNDQVKKLSLLSKDEIPSIANFAKVIFPPGESDPVHFHKNIYEAILILEGTGNIKSEGKNHKLWPDDFVVLKPKEKHSIKNTSKKPLILLCFGVRE